MGRRVRPSSYTMVRHDLPHIPVLSGKVGMPAPTVAAHAAHWRPSARERPSDAACTAAAGERAGWPAASRVVRLDRRSPARPSMAACASTSTHTVTPSTRSLCRAHARSQGRQCNSAHREKHVIVRRVAEREAADSDVRVHPVGCQEVWPVVFAGKDHIPPPIIPRAVNHAVALNRDARRVNEREEVVRRRVRARPMDREICGVAAEVALDIEHVGTAGIIQKFCPAGTKTVRFMPDDELELA